MVIGRGVVDEKENLSTTFVEIQKNRSEMLRTWKTYPQKLWIIAQLIFHVEKLENLSTLDVEELAQKHEILFLIVFHIKCG